MNIKNTSKKKHNKKYETPKKIGEKWQIDAKYVPNAFSFVFISCGKYLLVFSVFCVILLSISDSSPFV